MKLAIPVDDTTIESSVCPSFGRAPYFLIYDTATTESSCLDNNAVASQGGAGVKAAQSIIDCGATVLLTPRCGENAEEVFRTASVALYKSISGTARQNIDAFESGSLVLLSDFHPGLHHNEK